MTSKNPQIRFEGFTEAWEQRKLGDIGNFKNGMNFAKEAMGHGNPFVNLQDIFGKNILEELNGLGLAESSDKQKQEYNLLKGDVLFIRSSVKPSGVGETVLVPRDYPDTTYSGFIIRFRSNIELNNNFKRYVFGIKSFRNQILEKATSSANTNINQKSLANINILLPEVEEQKCIGAFLKQLDKTIALHQHELTLLTQRKKAFLQKMFPKKGESIPENRFPGFTKKWKTLELGTLVDINTGKLDANAMSHNGKYDFYTSGIKKYKINDYAFDGPAITIAGNGATVGYMHYANGKFNAYQRTYVLNNFKAVREYLYLEIERKLPRKIKEEARTGNIPYIVMGMLTELNIQIPTNEEQVKIGNFFKLLDDSITLQDQKLDSLKQMKKAFLQKMFV